MKVHEIIAIVVLLLGTTNASQLRKKSSRDESPSPSVIKKNGTHISAISDGKLKLLANKEVHKRGVFHNHEAYASSYNLPRTYASHFGYGLHYPATGYASAPSVGLTSGFASAQSPLYLKYAGVPRDTLFKSLVPTAVSSNFGHAHAHILPLAPTAVPLPHTSEVIAHAPELQLPHTSVFSLVRPGGALVSSYNANYPQFYHKPTVALNAVTPLQSIHPVQPVHTLHPLPNVTPIQQPLQPIQPVQSVHHLQPLQPLQPIPSVQSVHHLQPLQPLQPIPSVQSVHHLQPLQPLQPIAPVQSVHHLQPLQPLQPIPSVQSVHHLQPLQPIQPVVQTSFVQPNISPIPVVPGFPVIPTRSPNPTPVTPIFPAIPTFPAPPAFPIIPTIPAVSIVPTATVTTTATSVPSVTSPPFGIQPHRPNLQPAQPPFFTTPVQPAAEVPSVPPLAGSIPSESGSAEAAPQIPSSSVPAPIPEPEFPPLQPQPTQTPWKPMLYGPPPISSSHNVNRPSITLLPPYGGSSLNEGYLPPAPSQQYQREQPLGSSIFDELSSAEIEHVFAQAVQQQRHRSEYLH